MVTTSSRTKSNGPVLRSQSPSGRFCGAYSNPIPSSSSSAFASSTSSSFSSPSSAFFSNHHRDNHHHSHHRSASPTRVNLYKAQPIAFSSLDSRSISPTNRSISVSKKPQPSSHHHHKISSPRRCMCSPTTHPGSFRCSLHKNVANPHGQGAASSSSYPTSSLNMRRSAMTNSLVRIGGVEGEWVRRALTTLIRPSSHHLRRRAAYQPRPSRLSIVSMATECN
ncbi:serine-rich protein-related [Raphanus sativus]|nr:serine-rich protein-related [Raphanus sativus]